MAINLYCGLMGSGKSYEVVSNVLLPALKAGRRVVTNIDGLNDELIIEYLTRTSRKASFLGFKCSVPIKNAPKKEDLGELVHVSSEQVQQDNFYPMSQDDTSSLVKPGDLVILDECWKFYDSGSKLSENAKTFFRMHRHLIDEKTGLTSDMAFIFQSDKDPNRFLSEVFATTFRMSKLNALGLTSRYRVDVYTGGKVLQRAKTSSIQYAYKKEIFPLYQSYYLPEGGKEKKIDNRSNVFSGKFKYVIPGALILMGYSGYKFFTSIDSYKSNYSDSSLPSNVSSDLPSSNAPIAIKKEEKPLKLPTSAFNQSYFVHGSYGDFYLISNGKQSFYLDSSHLSNDFLKSLEYEKQTFYYDFKSLRDTYQSKSNSGSVLEFNPGTTGGVN